MVKTLKITHWVMIAATAALAFALIFCQCSTWHYYNKKATVIEQAAESKAHADYQQFIDKAQAYEEKETILFPCFLTALMLTLTAQAARIFFWIIKRRRNRRYREKTAEGDH